MNAASLPFGPQIAAAAARHGLDPRLLAAVAAQETGGPGSDAGRNVVGDGGHGRGLFQIDDRWHPFARTPAAMDPAANADYAAGLLAANLHRYGGDVHAALSAYNAGDPHAAGTRTDWGDRVLGYADSVLRHYTRLGGPPPVPQTVPSASPSGCAPPPSAAPPPPEPGADGVALSLFGFAPRLPAHRAPDANLGAPVDALLPATTSDETAPS